MDSRPVRPTSWLRRVALGLLALAGWRTVLAWPPEPKGVIIVYPHTSNWDFILGMLFKVGHGLPANWVGKTEMFPWPQLPARSSPGSHRRVNTIGTNDGILDTPTIDAVCAGVERARLNVQIIEDFTDQ